MPIKQSLNHHEMRPFDFRINYKQTILDLKKEEQYTLQQ